MFFMEVRVRERRLKNSMFNGIIETTGTIETIQTTNSCKQFTITPKKIFNDVAINDSVAVNGVCLTVTHIQNNCFDVTVVPETLQLTNLDQLVPLDIVNLERSIKLTDRISGHWVQGHVDGMGEIMQLDSHGDALLVKISIPPTLANYIVNKGYITLDGMSITVIQAEPEWITVTFIPHTQQLTIINQYKIGSRINIEVDILGKYIAKQMKVI